MRRRCEDCRFWSPAPRPDDARRDPEPQAQCRRFPPQAVSNASGAIRAIWPITKADQWCGEFAA